jgi:hypothetical protein
MILPVLAAAAVAAAPAPASGTVAECIWSKLPAYKEQVLAAPDFETFDKLRRAWPEEATATAFAACVPEGGNDAAAETSFTYYEVSMWARRRLAVKWPEATLARVDAIPEDKLRYFWLQPAPEQQDAAFRQARAEAWARVYEPFGRSGPAAKGDDLEMFIVGRTGWRLGEIDYREGLKKR